MEHTTKQKIDKCFINKQVLPTVGRLRSPVPPKSAAQRMLEYRQRLKEQQTRNVKQNSLPNDNSNTDLRQDEKLYPKYAAPSHSAARQRTSDKDTTPKSTNLATNKASIFLFPCKPTGNTKPKSCELDIETKFINHVIMIWLNRVRRGDRKIMLPNSVLKAKAKEVAIILNISDKFQPTEWLYGFKDKLAYEDGLAAKMFIRKNPSLNIADIIKEEQLMFFNENDGNEGSTSKGTNEDEECAIQNYDEALDCLKLIETYAANVQNLEAVDLIGQIEGIMRMGKSSKRGQYVLRNTAVTD